MKIGLVAGAVVIIVALAGYAAYLHWLLYRQRRRARQEPHPAPSADSPVGIVEPGARSTVPLTRSLYLLADAILDDKLTHTEGCLRICAIASGLDDQARFRTEYGVLFTVAEATAHIPILDAWKALPTADKRRYDKERMAVELKYGEAVLEAARRLKEDYPL